MMATAALQRSTARSSATETTTSAQLSASVLEFACLYTYDVRRKNTKRWHDGRLRFHTFNRRAMLYDSPARNFLGDTHCSELGQGDELQDGDEITLERCGALVQVAELIERSETNLKEVVKDRKPTGEAIGRNSRLVPTTPARSLAVTIDNLKVRESSAKTNEKRGLVGSGLKHRSLNSLLGAARGPLGKAMLAAPSPFELRTNGINGDAWEDRHQNKRRKIEMDCSLSKSRGDEKLWNGTVSSKRSPVIRHQTCIDLTGNRDPMSNGHAPNSSWTILSSPSSTSSPGRLSMSPEKLNCYNRPNSSLMNQNININPHDKLSHNISTQNALLLAVQTAQADPRDDSCKAQPDDNLDDNTSSRLRVKVKPQKKRTLVCHDQLLGTMPNPLLNTKNTRQKSSPRVEMSFCDADEQHQIDGSSSKGKSDLSKTRHSTTEHKGFKAAVIGGVVRDNVDAIGAENHALLHETLHSAAEPALPSSQPSSSRMSVLSKPVLSPVVGHPSTKTTENMAADSPAKSRVLKSNTARRGQNNMTSGDNTNIKGTIPNTNAVPPKPISTENTISKVKHIAPMPTTRAAIDKPVRKAEAPKLETKTVVCVNNEPNPWSREAFDLFTWRPPGWDEENWCLKSLIGEEIAAKP